eukprot:1007991-Amphidinium_carterae.1
MAKGSDLKASELPRHCTEKTGVPLRQEQLSQELGSKRVAMKVLFICLPCHSCVVRKESHYIVQSHTFCEWVSSCSHMLAPVQEKLPSPSPSAGILLGHRVCSADRRASILVTASASQQINRHHPPKAAQQFLVW